VKAASTIYSSTSSREFSAGLVGLARFDGGEETEDAELPQWISLKFGLFPVRATVCCRMCSTLLAVSVACIIAYRAK